jgi:putative Mg2+ transporter-C (MgtC) family protein
MRCKRRHLCLHIAPVCENSGEPVGKGLPMDDSIFIYILRLIAAIVAGAVVGFERELHDKPAGFRTNILICFGAALFTVMSITMVGEAYSDRARIAAGVVTGVGFLGAGTIVHFKGNVLGLTTAATIWAVASVGMAFGAGEYVIGTVATVLTAAVLFGLAFAEDLIASWRVTARFKIKLDPSLRSADEVRGVVDETGMRIHSWMITKVEEALTLRISVIGPAQRIEKLQADLAANEHVHSIRRV